jgi:hypothetical protein
VALKAKPQKSEFVRRKSDGKLAIVSEESAAIMCAVGTWSVISKSKFKKCLKNLHTNRSNKSRKEIKAEMRRNKRR